MKTSRLWIVLIAFLITGTAVDTAWAKKIEQIGLTWYTTLEEGLQVAQKEDKPILLDFWDHRSGAYKQQFEHTYKDSRVKAMFQKFVLVTVHLVKEYETAKKYRVSQVPLVAFLVPSGKELARHRLARTVTPELLIERMNTVLSDLEELDKLRKHVEQHPGDFKNLLKLAQLYEGWIWDEEAIDSYRRIADSPDVDSETRELARLGWARCLMASANRLGVHGDTGTAVDRLRQYIELFPKHEQINEARFMLAMYLIEEGKNNEAADLLKQVKKNTRGKEADRADAILKAIEPGR